MGKAQEETMAMQKQLKARSCYGHLGGLKNYQKPPSQK
jgi:hypothetical protein